MSKIITINKFAGMKDGGSYFLQGFQPAFMGNKQVLRQEWKTTDSKTTLDIIVGSALKKEASIFSGALGIYFIDVADNIDLAEAYYLDNYANEHNIVPTYSTLPDIIASLASGLLYTSARYLGRRLTGTDDSASNDKATSVVDTGTNFTTEGVQVGATIRNLTDGSRGVVTSISTTTGTNDTLNFSGGLSGGTGNDFDNGDSYAVYADQFQDLGAEQAAWSRQIFIFENIHLIGNGNYLATIDKDEANFSASYKQLREGWMFRAGAANNGMVAVANNKDYKGKISFWNGWSDGWNNEIDLDNEVDTIKPYSNGWIFNSGSDIYFTNGYTKTLISKFPDIDAGLTMNIKPNGLLVLGDKAMFNYQGFLYGTAKTGIWILDLVKRDWILAPFGDEVLYSNTTVSGGIFFNPNDNKIFYGYYNKVIKRLGVLEQNYRGASPSQSTFLFPVKLGRERQITKIEIDWSKSSLCEGVWNAQSIDITVAVGDGKKVLWAYGQTNSASDTEDILEINNSVDGYNKVEIGDEVLILDGATAGERAFITKISGAGTNTCVLTLDRSLSAKTANSVHFNILPLKKAKGTNTYTAVEMATFFPEANLGAEAMIEICVKQASSNIFPIQIEEIRIYVGE